MVLAQLPVAPMVRAHADDQGPIIIGNPAPSLDKIQSLIARAVENQHRNDRAIEEFERVEHVIMRRDQNAEVVSDRTDLVIPSGTGTMKLPMAASGTPVPQDTYRQELQYAVTALDLALHPNDRYKQDMVKFERRRRDRREFLETAAKAFRFKWAGRETLPGSVGGHGSHSYTKFLLEPDPAYKPPTRIAVTFQHIHAVLWMDESQAQFARLEGDITSDITFGGGIVGKVYHGGHFSMEQSEVAPGVWLPTLYTYDVDGRKFMFGFGVHERTEVTRYRHLGPPEQSIQIIRNELNNLTAETPAH
ncbi:MAG: hypothetical protein ABSA96_07425 [Candidatus Acidiferrales bacterium]|jgi:hypothetical protein